MKIRYESPRILDHGSIAAHAYSRCDSGAGDWPPKDSEEFPHDKFGECSSGHVS